MHNNKVRCLVYIPWPYNGQGPAESCVKLLQSYPGEVLQPVLFLPRATKSIPNSIHVEQTLSFVQRHLPWQLVAKAGLSSLNDRFAQAIDTADPSSTITYFWPDPPIALVERARKRGLLTVREMINSFRGTAKTILDRKYANLGMTPGHTITDESVAREREELQHYDFIFASNAEVEASLLHAGIDTKRIIPTSFGWSPTRFPSGRRRVNAPFRALFVGSVCVRKGVPHLLAAWKQSGVKGELVLAGKIEEAIKPLLQPYLADSSVRLLDYVPDVGSLYWSADVFIFPTLEEGGPQVTYEAAGCGLPVITTPAGAGRIIRDGINGLIVEPNNIEDLAQAIKQLAGSGETRKRMAHEAFVDAQQFTYEKVGLARCAHLKHILDQRAGSIS